MNGGNHGLSSKEHAGSGSSFRRRSLLWTLAILAAFLLYVGTRGSSDGLAEIALLFGLCFACELVDSGLGMGYGTILTPSLLLLGYAPADIVPTILFSELFSGFAAAFFHNEARNVHLGFQGKDLGPAVLLAVGSLVGVLAGVLLALNLPKDSLGLLIGCIVLASGLGVLLLARYRFIYRRWKMLLLATVASFNKAVSGGGYGPLLTSGQILSGIRGQSAVGITSFAEAFTCMVAVTAFLIRGGHITVSLFIPMCLGALVSVPLSVFAISRAREGHLKVVIGVLTAAMGGLTILKSL